MTRHLNPVPGDDEPGGYDPIPPNDLEAEEALLGAILVDPAQIETALAWVVYRDFHAPIHSIIFEAYCRLYAAGTPIDKISVAAAMRSAGALDKVGGLAYLSRLMDAVPTTASTAYYARTVREKAILRDLIAAGRTVVRLAYEGNYGSADDAIAGAEQAIATVVERIAGNEPLEEPEARLARTVDLVRNGVRANVVMSPWSKLDERCGGFGAGELIVIPASPMVGKTGLAISLADFIAERHGPVLFASMEMGVEAIDRRRIAMRSGASARKQRLAELSSDEKQQVYLAENVLAPNALYVTGRNQRSIMAIRRNAREIVRRRGSIAAMVLDHLLFLEDAKPEGRRSKHEAMDTAYMRLLELANEFDCPIFGLIHLSRSGGENNRPTFGTLEKIRDGGNVEGHATTAIFPYRADPMTKPTEGEFVVVKSRDGAAGAVKMHFTGSRALWVECDDNGMPKPAWFETARPRVPAPSMDFEPNHDDDVRNLF